MKTIYKLITTLALVLIVSSSSFSQTKADLSFSFFNRHEWRGFINQNSPTFEGSYTISNKNWSIGVWSGYGLTAESFKEVDFYASYSIGRLKLTILDYYDYTDQNAAPLGKLSANSTNHIIDGRFDFTISKNFPLKLTGSTIFFGNDRKYSTQDYSTYIELGYPIEALNWKYNFFVGGTTHKGMYSNSEGANIIRVGVETSHKIKISESTVIPTTLKLITNPRTEQIVFIIAVKII